MFTLEVCRHWEWLLPPGFCFRLCLHWKFADTENGDTTAFLVDMLSLCLSLWVQSLYQTMLCYHGCWETMSCTQSEPKLGRLQWPACTFTYQSLSLAYVYTDGWQTIFNMVAQLLFLHKLWPMLCVAVAHTCPDIDLSSVFLNVDQAVWLPLLPEKLW